VKNDESKQILQTDNDNHVCVGRFDQLGFNVNNNWNVNPNDNLGVVLSRNFLLCLFKPLL